MGEINPSIDDWKKERKDLLPKHYSIMRTLFDLLAQEAALAQSAVPIAVHQIVKAKEKIDNLPERGDVHDRIVAAVVRQGKKATVTSVVDETGAAKSYDLQDHGGNGRRQKTKAALVRLHW